MFDTIKCCGTKTWDWINATDSRKTQCYDINKETACDENWSHNDQNLIRLISAVSTIADANSVYLIGAP